jgi:hypothetical protein
MGMFNWFRKYIPNFSAIANPFYKLMKKDVTFEWNSECQNSFNDLKHALVHSEALAFPRFDLQFRLAVDTSSKGIGYMLYQIHDNGNKRVVRFGSKGLSKWQQSYGPTKLELLGVVTSVLDCASYLRGRHFVIECDHQALRPLFQKQLKGAIYERWLAILQQFDCDIQWKSAAEMVVADSLSRTPTYPEVLSSSPAEDDDFFPFVSDKPTVVRLLSSEKSAEKLCINHVDLMKKSDVYDADTEDNIGIVKQNFRHRKKTHFHRNRRFLTKRPSNKASQSVCVISDNAVSQDNALNSITSDNSNIPMQPLKSMRLTVLLKVIIHHPTLMATMTLKNCQPMRVTII